MNEAPNGSDGKESPCHAEDLGLIPDQGKALGEGEGKRGFLPGESHRQRSLAGYSPWSRKESNTNERLTLPLS